MVREDPDTLKLLKPIRLRGHSVKPWPMPPTVDEVYDLTLRCWAHDPSAPYVHVPDTIWSDDEMTASACRARTQRRTRQLENEQYAREARGDFRRTKWRKYTPPLPPSPPPALTLSDRVNAMSREEIRDWLMMLAAERLMGLI
jgi:hypothetical protein